MKRQTRSGAGPTALRLQRMSLLRRVALVFMAAAIVLVSQSCASLLAPFRGTIQVRLYSQYYADSPEELQNPEYDLFGLVQIDGLRQQYFLTDSSGSVTIPNVRPGTYSIHPVFGDPAYDVSVTVAPEQIAEATIVVPDRFVYSFVLNTQSETTPELQQIDFRRALALAIDRSSLISDLGREDTFTPLKALIPTPATNSSFGTVEEIRESTADATSLLNPGDPVSFAMLYSTDQVALDYLKALYEGLDGIGLVTLEPDTFANTLERMITGDFEVARFGWALDANDPYNLLVELVQRSGFDSVEYHDLIASIENARAEGDALRYLDLIDQLHALCLDNMIAVPLYQNIP